MKPWNKGLIFIIIAVMGITGCAGMQAGNVTPDQAYYMALGTWYDAASTFKNYYEVVDEATRLKWDREFRPILIHAKEILDAWYVNLSDQKPTTDQIAQWKQLKTRILIYIADNIQKEKSQ